MNPGTTQNEENQGGGSLRARLLLVSLAWIVLTLALAGWGLRGMFRDHITQQLEAQLVLHLNQLSAAVHALPQGQLKVTPIASDPRFEKPLSGLYWQVDELHSDAGRPPAVAHAAIARSRSLWDQELALPSIASFADSGRSYTRTTVKDTEGSTLVAVSRNLQLPEADAPPLRLTVAADRAMVAEPINRFTSLLLATLAALALGLAIAVLLQLQFAMRPLKQLRKRLADVREGHAHTLEGRFPKELQPLVTEFNKVLNANGEMVQRARTQAGNLAHAVHTPLAIMSNAADNEHSTLARLVQEQTGIARRQVDYHLARARATTAVRATGVRTALSLHLQALVRTMQRLHAARNVEFVLRSIPPDLAFRGEEQDFYELLGNLIDNAGKWAHSRVEIHAAPMAGDMLSITIDDDGPGMSTEQYAQAQQRGVRLDEKRPGSGLGLDIVRELTQTYGGHIQAQASPLGGLRMRLELPAVGSAPD